MIFQMWSNAAALLRPRNINISFSLLVRILCCLLWTCSSVSSQRRSLPILISSTTERKQTSSGSLQAHCRWLISPAQAKASALLTVLGCRYHAPQVPHRTADWQAAAAYPSKIVLKSTVHLCSDRLLAEIWTAVFQIQDEHPNHQP